jgi:hypothetical protein
MVGRLPLGSLHSPKASTDEAFLVQDLYLLFRLRLAFTVKVRVES